ncbi:MAG: hypothetical protein C4538_01390 [Nitrospiraceae bacterium]|nr:MAG: hypothetical protein C4538_01390 [Nitrospiraceae bacterium]
MKENRYEVKRGSPLISTLKQAKRVIRVVVGLTILLAGLIMILLPGPGTVVILIGLAILATEFVWAKKLMDRFKDGANNLKNSILNHKTKDRDSSKIQQ